MDNLRYADDIDLLADTYESLQDLTYRVDDSGKRMGLKINVEKQKQNRRTMAIGKQVRLGGGVLEQVTRFAYLGGLIRYNTIQFHLMS